MPEHFELLKTEIENRKFYITMNRPEKRNALNGDMVTELKKAFKQAEKDEVTKTIILRAAGKAFSAGADLGYLQELQDFTYGENLEDSQHLKGLYEQIYFLKKPVIAQVEGHAIAGGCGLATVCDFVFATQETKFGYTEVKIGFIPAIVMTFLLRKIGEAKARELILTGKLIKAPEFKEMGVVNEVYEPDEIREQVKAFADQLAEETSLDAVGLTKELMAKIQSRETEQAINLAAEYNAKARETDDCKKGINAFLNKEAMKW